MKTGDRYRIRLAKGWVTGTWWGNDLWQLEDRSLINKNSVLEVGQAIKVFECHFDPFSGNYTRVLS